ncbi:MULTISPECIES: hypothetical protein [unclassified Lentimicrobium]|uniref:hypothetical protein n=1 Tax=unclassified Lentimicrobium TaxID=2677434 RepID=UPI001554A46F|nr:MULTISPECIES: hypothetical protein [unclassified Lentimicrobium]NPD46019.1 hypothetical protein [Lentimicrobium sp. S6]NPD85219.1 hypothetical protein [Lentimicrobium sp. L6]
MISIYRNTIKLILFILCISSLFFSCGKCNTKSLGQPFCDNGYNEWTVAEIIEGSITGFDFNNSPIVIRRQTQYDSLMSEHKPIEVDFEKHTLLGMGGGGSGQGINTMAWVCRNTQKDEVKMYVKYSMENQCAGSGIISIPFVYWAKVPKLSTETKVYFEAIDVNPFDD